MGGNSILLLFICLSGQRGKDEMTYMSCLKQPLNRAIKHIHPLADVVA